MLLSRERKPTAASASDHYTSVCLEGLWEHRYWESWASATRWKAPRNLWHFPFFLSSWEGGWAKGEQLDASLTLSSHLPAKGQSLAYSQLLFLSGYSLQSSKIKHCAKGHYTGKYFFHIFSSKYSERSGLRQITFKVTLQLFIKTWTGSGQKWQWSTETGIWAFSVLEPVCTLKLLNRTRTCFSNGPLPGY